eukprot:gnl/TRDRNA2_/TRDRNA2_177786_c0_seq15.p1 gnl/TRDRNA2_/TRDRNA2_177786_c0~~gnl/TRDRNA2_/TRDRNA2_177786_c0_seq15.p1  ORF type:complete len:562 (-),score=63.59 gnl/TRDRNA2_/TRDRNA2_177786_c0_seq15:289-1926(-)
MASLVRIFFEIFLLSTSALAILDSGSTACDVDGERHNTSDFLHVDLTKITGHLSLLQTNARISRSPARETRGWEDRRAKDTWDRIRLWPYKGGKSKTIQQKRRNNAVNLPFRSFKSKRELFRPLWQKNLRCRGPSQESCEECIGADDCWTFVKDAVIQEVMRNTTHVSRLGLGTYANRPAVNAVQSQWVRHVNRIHILCDSNIFFFQMAVAKVVNGKIRVRWDGVEINRHTPEAQLRFSFHKYAFTLDDTGGMWNYDLQSIDLPIVGDEHGKMIGGARDDRFLSMLFVIPVSNAGGHDLEIEFEPASSPAKVEFAALQLYMPRVYSNCEDMKVCLARLAKAGVAGQKLRNTNTLQKECLSSSKEGHAILKKEGVFKACRQWRKCLKEHQVAVGVLLDAAGVGEFTDQSPEAAATAVSEAKCIYPPHEDPESWDCDCYKEMLLRCQNANTKNLPQGSYTEKICLRAHFCLSPRVCTGWKSAACADPLVVAMKGALPNDHTSALSTTAMHNTSLSLSRPTEKLLSRSSFAEATSAKLDESGKAKRCK